MNLAEITSKYVGAPFKIGGQSRDEGFDCFSLIFCLARDLGNRIPDEFDGLTLNNYPALYATSEDAAIAKLIEFAEMNCREVPISKAFVGDLLIMRDHGGGRFAALHAGNDFIISSFINVGVSIARIRTFILERAFKWEKVY